MRDPRIERLRRKLDDAITYGDTESARRLAAEGFAIARDKELLGEMMYFKSQMAIIDGNFMVAMEYLDLAIEYTPHDGAAYNDRGLCMAEIGMINEAFYYFDRGIEVEPGYATIYHNKGWLLNKIGHHKEAISCLKKALQLDPERPVTYENLADAYAKLGRYRAALKAYKQAIELLKPSRGYIRVQIDAEIKKIATILSLSRQHNNHK